VKYTILLAIASMALLNSSTQAASIKTSIDITAEVATSVRVYVDGNDVTNGSISLKLQDINGYMGGTTPAFQFVGNATSVSLTLTKPSSGGLISENNDPMLLNANWLRPDGNIVSATYAVHNIPVYATIEDIPDLNDGYKVDFKSTQRSETYPIGTYSGTYEIIVTPSV